MPGLPAGRLKSPATAGRQALHVNLRQQQVPQDVRKQRGSG